MPPPIVAIPLPGDVPAERAAQLVRGDSRPFALCGAWASSQALCGSSPLRCAPSGAVVFDVFRGTEGEGSDVGGQGDSPVCVDWTTYEGVQVTHTPSSAVGGGWFGILGFGLGRAVERVSDPPPRPLPLPEARLAFYDHLLRLDGDGQWWFEALWTPERDEALRARRDELAARLARGLDPPGEVVTAPWRSVPGPAGHAAAVGACRRRIEAGDLFQANLTTRLESRMERGDAADLFARGVAALRPDRAAFVAGPGWAVASLSPELFLERRGRAVRSAPIKGTASERDHLASSAKDRAENVMIVDLVRNDLGRVCVPGSIEVPALAEPRPHTGVWHLVSEVTGTLREDATDADLLRAAFPPGSVTGAPKVAALDVIAELESTGREAYTGAIGFASPLAGLELNVAIRTFELAGDAVWLGAGGGVVADSDPEAEAAEAAAKAKPLLDAIGGRLAPPRSRARRAPSPLRLAPRPIPRPDPALGVFETIRAEGGKAQRLDDHLARLSASVAALYDAPLPPDAGRLVTEAAARAGDGRVRLDARPAGALSGAAEASEEILLAVECGPVSPVAPDGLRLEPVCIPGGLGPHKWADRRLIEALGAAVAPAIPLIVDLDGLVLEASRWSVVIAEGADLVTPPLDGRILPGVGRGALTAREEEIDLDRLEAADAVLLVNALRGTSVVRGSPPPPR